MLTRLFYNHQDDPGYRQWRADAERKAQDNPVLKAKLDQLDSDLAARQGRPRDPHYLPTDVPGDVAHAGSAQARGGALLWLLLLLAGTIVLYSWGGRRRRNARWHSDRSMWASHKGAATVKPLQTIRNLLRRKASDQRYTPSLFRVGMTLAVDPAPFLLVGGVTKVSAPADAGQLTSVEAVGTLDSSSGSTSLTRLYLPGSTSFFQIHVDKAGQPDECRYFTVIDEVYPADAEEWGFWLDEAEGMIGWPEFQTKDGKTYGRVWTPGTTHTPPLRFEEKINSVDRTRTLSIQAMLYGATTGAPRPAPQTEYILVSAVEEGPQAWVRIAAGIDISPASLSLS